MIELSNRLTILYEEYSGDDAWGNFVSCFPEINTDLLNQIPIETDFVRALYWKKGDNLDRVKNWLEKPLPALDGKTPFEILKLEEGKTILRTAIMRMP